MHKVSHRDQEGLGQDRQGHLLMPLLALPLLVPGFRDHPHLGHSASSRPLSTGGRPISYTMLFSCWVRGVKSSPQNHSPFSRRELKGELGSFGRGHLSRVTRSGQLKTPGRIYANHDLQLLLTQRRLLQTRRGKAEHSSPAM